MDKDIEYVRVGTQLYKIVHVPTLQGDEEEQLIPWKYGTLKQDYAKDDMPVIPKYDGFCTIPSHTDYQPSVGNFLNLYKPISHEPAEGEFLHVEALMRHIFEEQYELGMDYLQLLYLRPIQKLPILLLVSEERNTGKSTFLNFMKAIFQDNATFNTNEDFRSQFNADWAGKLLIVVDEVLLSRKEDSERLKNLSTAFSYKIEAKGKDRQEVHFFAKFILCSNNEAFPVMIDPVETRYWVRKVKRLETDDTNFLDSLKAEIPALLHHLQHRQLSTERKSRMWFAPSLIHTEALDRIISSNRSKVETDIIDVCLDVMAKENIAELTVAPKDLLEILKFYGAGHDLNAVRKVLRDVWRLKPASNGFSYTTYAPDWSKETQLTTCKRKGRFFTVTRDFLQTLC